MIKARRSKPLVSLVISSTQVSTYNLFTAAGSPGGAVDVVLTINTGVVLQAGLIGTSFAAGSSIVIINNGRIAGIAGAGSGGVGLNGSSGFDTSGVFTGDGGHAIETNVPTSIDNTNGEIFGGGGGGGAGAATRQPVGGPYTYRAGGGGGGGGQGYNNASGGTGGVSAISVFENGGNGVAGSSAAPGTGGTANVGGGVGGDGGSWGASGAPGQFAASDASSSYNGGAGGYAVKTNGAGVSWLGGNNGTQVKGTAV